MINLLVAALAISFMAGQSPMPAPQIVKVAGLHLLFNYPSDFKDSQEATSSVEEARTTSKPEIKAALTCVTTPLAAVRPEGSNSYDLILMLDMDLDCLKAPVSSAVLAPIASQSVTQGLQKLGAPVLSPSAPYKLDGHDSVFIKASVTPEQGQPSYSNIACSLVEHHVVCWTTLTTNRLHLKAMLSSPVTFGDHAPVPVVPAELLAK